MQTRLSGHREILSNRQHRNLRCVIFQQDNAESHIAHYIEHTKQGIHLYHMFTPSNVALLTFLMHYFTGQFLIYIDLELRRFACLTIVILSAVLHFRIKRQDRELCPSKVTYPLALGGGISTVANFHVQYTVT